MAYNMNDILEEYLVREKKQKGNLISLTVKVNLQRRRTIQKDNNPKHTAKNK